MKFASGRVDTPHVRLPQWSSAHRGIVVDKRGGLQPPKQGEHVTDIILDELFTLSNLWS